MNIIKILKNDKNILDFIIVVNVLMIIQNIIAQKILMEKNLIFIILKSKNLGHIIKENVIGLIILLIFFHIIL